MYNVLSASFHGVRRLDHEGERYPPANGCIVEDDPGLWQDYIGVRSMCAIAAVQLSVGRVKKSTESKNGKHLAAGTKVRT